MNIIQDFEPVCDNCPELAPDCDVDNFYAGSQVYYSTITLSCKNKEWCRNMREHLKMTQEEQNESNS